MSNQIPESFIEGWIGDLGISSLTKIEERNDVSTADKKRAEKEASNFADKKNKKYKLDTKEQIEAAWRYIGMPKNQKKYSTADVASIKRAIISAWKKKIDPKGPPAAQKKEKAKKVFGSAGNLKKTFQIFTPLSKVSEGPNGEVYVEGFLARTDMPDKTPGLPEQMDEALSLPHFEKMVAETVERSGGQSKFPVREMHQSIAAGRGLDYKYVPGKGFWGKVEVVDPASKEKAVKGVLTSFSVGGHYGKTWIDNGILHYEGKPIEATLADVGMIPGTEFEFVHADGSTEMRKFASLSGDQQHSLKKMLEEMKNDLNIKKFIETFAGLRKEEGGYSINPDYARQESWNIATGAEVIQVATRLMSGEANEPEDAKEVANIIRAVLEFMEGETDEMESAATGEEPEAEAEEASEAEQEPTEESEADEPEEEPEEAGEEAEEDDDESEEDEPDEQMDDEHIKEIVRALLAELAEAEKFQRIGDLSKVQSTLGAQIELLDKSQKNIVNGFAKSLQDLAGDIAKTLVLEKDLETKLDIVQKAVDSYGPVMHEIPNKERPLSNGQNVTEKSILKSLIADKSIGAQLRQAYQARLTELEIKEQKPLEEPPEFTS